MLVNRSKTGLPTITENGGGATNTGNSTIICSQDGKAVKPLFVPKGYSNGDHAIFVAKPGMLLIQANHSRNGESIVVLQIIAIGSENEPDELITIEIYSYENGDGNIPDWLKAATDAALAKSYCYHCREPHFIIGRE